MNNNKSAVIVLSNLMDRNGLLNKESQERANKAFRVFDSLKDAIIVTSGWDYIENYPLTIAEATKEYLINKFKIDSERILCEKNSRDTVGDAFFTRVNIIERLNIDNLFVVTSSYHCIRAYKIFKFIYHDSAKINIISSDKYLSNKLKVKEEKQSLTSFNETFFRAEKGDMNEIYKILTKFHPFYNGDRYPKL